jgi:hypothetical protein
MLPVQGRQDEQGKARKFRTGQGVFLRLVGYLPMLYRLLDSELDEQIKSVGRIEGSHCAGVLQ